MDKEWQQEKEKWYNSEIAKRRDIIVNGIKTCNLILEENKEKLIKRFDSVMQEGNTYKIFSFCSDIKYGYFDYCDADKYEHGYALYIKWLKEIDIEAFSMMFEYKSTYDGTRYLDSEPVEFDGDIIITDPCYIMRAEHHGTKPLTDNDWYACDYGSKMEVLGIHTYMTRDTLYGDWSCTTYNTDTEEEIGEFCADAGLVSVFLLDEVLKYNPDFDYHKDRRWTTTWIKNFKGTVQFVIAYTDGYYEDETKWHKKGEHWEDYSVKVVGHGVDKATGKPINFVGKQTGF